MIEILGRKAAAGFAALLLLAVVAAGEPRVAPRRPDLELLLDQAVAAANAERFAEALELYRDVERSADPSYAWAGTSGQVIVHRMARDGDSARAVTERIAAARPELAGLMDVWDGDTALLERDSARALAAYRRAADLHGRQVVDGIPVGVKALRQLSRAQLEARDPLEAAQTERELLRSYPGFSDRTEALARILAFQAMASGDLPLKPLEALVQDGDCSRKRPCVLGAGRVGRESTPDDTPVAEMDGVYVLSGAAAEALGAAESARPEGFTPVSNATACLTPTAESGFAAPMLGNVTGYKFMEHPDCCGGYHTGVDINRGGVQADCNDPFFNAADGCVRDVMSSNTDWGAAAVEHYYYPHYWTSQYGHAYEVYVSVDQLVRRGKLLGRVGGTANGGPDTFACHLHFEIREEDHTARNDATAYHNAALKTVADEYQDPLPFVAAHKAYQRVLWRDENDFTLTGTWTRAADVGDEDDMTWAPTTKAAALTNYARHTFTAPAAGRWELWAFVPYTNRSSNAVPYKLLDASTGVALFTKAVKQSDKKDAWVYVGSATLAADASYVIAVNTNTGESGKQVALDDFMIIQPSAEGLPDLTVNAIGFTRPPAAGVRTTAVAALANAGFAPTGTFRVKWLLDNVLVGYGSHDSLAPGTTSSGNVSFDWVPTLGQHTLQFVADVDGDVAEISEINNWARLAVTIRSPADLKVSGITFSKKPASGVRTTATAKLANAGKTASGAFAVKWYLDGVEVAHGLHASLSPAEVSKGNVRFAWTPTVGTHTLQFLADADSQVGETNESNNSGVVTATIVGPDLKVTGITVSPVPVVAGVRTTAVAQLANAGGSPSGPFNVKWFLDGAEVSYGGHASLAPGQASAGNVRFAWTPTAGTQTLEFAADVDGYVEETNEGNNSYTRAVVVQPRIDLAVTDVSFSDPTPNTGQGITVTASLSNTGTTNSPTFNCKWFVDGSQVAYFSIGVPAGTTVHPSIPWTPAFVGTYQWQFQADVDGQVAESNEGNNSYTRSVTVGCSTPPCPFVAPAGPNGKNE
jgi:subtilase family serine protease/murein DD-endopeptidase MepM/ murein hydrolase activator NlpD